MKEQIEHRLTELRRELDAGQKLLAELDAKQSHVKSSLLRISGAVQVLEELLSHEPGANGSGEGAAPVASAVAG